MKDQKLRAMLIFEIMGRPKEYLMESLDKLIETVGKEKGINLTRKNIREAKIIERKDKEGKVIPYKDEKDTMFTTFAELDLEASDIMDLLRIMFTYMPAHVEIIEPESFELTNIDINSIGNEILQRLHNYDSIAKAAIMNNQMLVAKMKEYIKNKEGGERKVEGKNIESKGEKEEMKSADIEKKEAVEESKDIKTKEKKRKS